ncbi:tetratricopeptide repeat protein [Thiovibrio sp. JS02]
MNEQQAATDEKQEEKSQAQKDYEAGIDFLKNKDASQAANAFHNALLGFQHDGDDNGIANASDKLGDICAERGEVEKALSHYDRAYAVCQKHTDRFSLFAIEKKKAKLMYDAKNYEKAIELYLDVLDEYGALRNPQGSVDTLETLAEIYLLCGDRAKAADSYRMAASIHKNFRHAKIAEKLLKKAAEVEKG